MRLTGRQYVTVFFYAVLSGVPELKFEHDYFVPNFNGPVNIGLLNARGLVVSAGAFQTGQTCHRRRLSHSGAADDEQLVGNFLDIRRHCRTFEQT